MLVKAGLGVAGIARKLSVANCKPSAAAAGLPDLLTADNIVYETAAFPGLLHAGESNLHARPPAARIFGRNFDFPTFGFLDKFSVLVVYRPARQTCVCHRSRFPGMLGVFSGMNDAGLVPGRNSK